MMIKVGNPKDYRNVRLQTFSQALASNLNWARRMLLGASGTVYIRNIPAWEDMKSNLTAEQMVELLLIQSESEKLSNNCKNLAIRIQQFQLKRTEQCRQAKSNSISSTSTSTIAKIQNPP